MIFILTKSIALVVTTASIDTKTHTAFRYISEALNMGIDVIGVFFYQDAALAANNYVNIANDEFQFIDALNALKDEHK